MQASDREQLLALMILDDTTGAKVIELDDTWVVMLTGPRFGGQYIYSSQDMSEELAIKANAGIADRIPRADLLQYYVVRTSEWAVQVMLGDYMKDNL